MKIIDALNSAKKLLREKNIESFSIDSLVLLQHATSFSKEKIIFNPEIILSQLQIDNFLQYVQRRANKEPVSHIIGKREFFGLDFVVNNKTLDPRPDSETLVEVVLKKFPKNEKIKILELGIGSGCLIISILKNLENAIGKGVDISLGALEICQKNLQNHKLENRLQIFYSDLFTQIQVEKFDLIISNPPYIKSQDIKNLQDEVRLYEPNSALDGGFDGLDFYRQIAQNSARYLALNGKIILEIGYGQENDVIEIFRQNNFVLQEQKCDLSGVVRCLVFELL